MMKKMMMMARWLSLLALSSSVMLFGIISAEPDYCKRGLKISQAYQRCFQEAHYSHPYLPLVEAKDIIDGCMVEEYNNHTCRVVKPAALECFRKNISRCFYRERIIAIADESGGACFGNHINRDFKEYVLNYLQPVRADSKCFILGDNAYECYGQAAALMHKLNPDLHLYTVDEYMPVANKFFESVYNCFIRIYKSNEPLCENWQIPLLLELQGIALPSLFGMSFTPDQMERLELHHSCPANHVKNGQKLHWRNCYDRSQNNDVTENRPYHPPAKPALKPVGPAVADESDQTPKKDDDEELKKKKKKKKDKKKKKNRKGKNKQQKKKKKKKNGRKSKSKKGRKQKQKMVKGMQKGGIVEEKGRPISPRFLSLIREAMSQE